jgi:hypothetical protein
VAVSAYGQSGHPDNGSSETEYCRLIGTYSPGEFVPALGLTAPLSLLGRADEVIQ